MAKETICKALASEERARLLVCLSKPQSVSELLNHCVLSQSALSQHLKILRDAEIVTTEKVGKYTVYKAVDMKIVSIAKMLLNYK